jgi:hypothetical protein
LPQGKRTATRRKLQQESLLADDTVAAFAHGIERSSVNYQEGGLHRIAQLDQLTGERVPRPPAPGRCRNCKEGFSA